METHSHVGGEGRAVIGEERQRRLKRLSGRTAKQRQGVGVRCWGGGGDQRETTRGSRRKWSKWKEGPLCLLERSALVEEKLHGNKSPLSNKLRPKSALTGRPPRCVESAIKGAVWVYVVSMYTGDKEMLTGSPRAPVFVCG